MDVKKGPDPIRALAWRITMLLGVVGSVLLIVDEKFGIAEAQWPIDPHLLATVHVLGTLMHEIGMAFLVAIPILWTVEKYNHVRSSKELEDRALERFRGGLPEEVWNTLEKYVVQPKFYKRKYHYSITITPYADAHLGNYYMLDVTNSFIVMPRDKEKKETWVYEPSTIRDPKFGHLTGYQSMNIGGDLWKKARLDLHKKTTGNLDEYRFENLEVDQDGLSIFTQELIAVAEDSPYFVFVTEMATRDFTIAIEAPATLKVDVDALHSSPSALTHGPARNNPAATEWSLRPGLGLLPMQGGVVRWTK